MKIKIAYLSLILTGGFLFILHSGFVNPYTSLTNPAFKLMQYQIRPGSVLEVNGETNVNSFCCTSKEEFPDRSLSYRIKSGTPSIVFQNAALEFRTEELDCGSKPINRDLRKSLRAKEYPQITIKLQEIINRNCEDLTNCNDFSEFIAKTDITITCETHSTTIPVKIKRMDTLSYRIIGSTVIKFCDYALEPPTAMMGLIKVKEDVEISFDLYVDLF